MSQSEFKTGRIFLSQIISLNTTQLVGGRIEDGANYLQLKRAKLKQGEIALHTVFFLCVLCEEMCPPMRDHYPSRGQLHLSNGGLWVSEFKLPLLKPNIWAHCRPGDMPMQPYHLFL